MNSRYHFATTILASLISSQVIMPNTALAERLQNLSQDNLEAIILAASSGDQKIEIQNLLKKLHDGSISDQELIKLNTMGQQTFTKIIEAAKPLYSGQN